MLRSELKNWGQDAVWTAFWQRASRTQSAVSIVTLPQGKSKKKKKKRSYLCRFLHLEFKVRLGVGVFLHVRLVRLCGFFGFESGLKRKEERALRWYGPGTTTPAVHFRGF